MYCPMCGVENSDDAKSCRSCGAVLAGLLPPAPPAVSKTSGLAIAALVLGILTPFTCGLTAIPAMVLGIIGLVGIEKSGGRLTGRGFAIGGIVVPVVVVPVLLIGLILTPLSFRTRQVSFRMRCATNLSGIGKAMLIYSNDYEDEFPRSGLADAPWGPELAAWDAPDRHSAFATDGLATISSSLYLLVKYAEVTPKTFICKGDHGATEFRLEDYPNRNASCRELIDAWDFGGSPGRHPTTHCSYSYHQPYSLYPLTNSFLPGMAVAADRNPFIESPSAAAEDMTGFVPDLGLAPYKGASEQAKISNSIAHQKDGQNVLFVDSHVAFERRAFCGIEDDNIYTWMPRGSDPPTSPLGQYPVPYSSGPGTRKDSYLVHDDPTARWWPGDRSRGR